MFSESWWENFSARGFLFADFVSLKKIGRLEFDLVDANGNLALHCCWMGVRFGLSCGNFLEFGLVCLRFLGRGAPLLRLRI